MHLPAAVSLACLASVLVGLMLPARAEEPPGTSAVTPVPIARLLTDPAQYGEHEVHIRGVIMKKARAVFPNGRPYSTLLVGDGQSAITVFSWADPPVGRGDTVDVVGVFHIWRYNLRHMIESLRITGLGSSTGRPATP